MLIKNFEIFLKFLARNKVYSLVTVTLQALKAASENPINAIKSE